MKKWFVFVLNVLLLLSLGACKQEKALSVSFDAIQTDYEGVSAQIVEGAWKDGELNLTLSLRNETEHLVIYGESFVVEREEDGQWVWCQAVENAVFTQLAYLLDPGETKEETYILTFPFVINEAGKYRFRTEFSVDEQNDWGKIVPNNSVGGQLWAEFTVTK